jgi:hypothetical protein
MTWYWYYGLAYRRGRGCGCSILLLFVLGVAFLAGGWLGTSGVAP